jgi:heme-degrading monooxygenase HmoA
MTVVEPGTVAVIFTSVRASDVDDGYAQMAEQMVELAAHQPGFVGVQSVRDAGTGVGITVSYWTDDQSARAWKNVAEHRIAQERGRAQWYADYSVVVAQVSRAYGRNG